MFSVDVFSIDDLIAELLGDDEYRVSPILTYTNELDDGLFEGFESILESE